MKRLARMTTVSLAIAMLVACSSQKVPAETAVKAVEDAMQAAEPDIKTYAGEKMAELQSGIDMMKQKLGSGDYAGVLTDASTLSTEVAAAAKEAATKKTAMAAEWASFATMPAMVAQITTKVAELSSARRLPRGMTKATVEEAKTSLETVNTAWQEATAAHEKGDLMTAVAKAKDVKPMVEQLMSTLGIAMPAM